MLCALALLGGEARPPAAAPPVPYLRDLSERSAALITIAAEPSWRAALQLARWQTSDPDCTTSAAGAFLLAADVAPAPGVETVLASYTAGLVVLDARGHKLAAAPPLVCAGSVDAIEYIAAIDPQIGDPVIAIAAVAGGRAERTTWLLLFVVRGERISSIFSAPVEEWRGPAVSAGEVDLLDGGALRHHAPSGAVTLWRYDRDAGRYVLREVLRGPGPAGGPAA